MNLKELASELRDFEGVKRKGGIGSIVDVLGLKEEGSRKRWFGDDAAVLEIGERTLLFACDGIVEKLVDADPYFAGYSSVLVNVNDIAAMGGRAVAMVDVLSAKDKKIALEIAKGVKDASSKFGVPLVGGHFNPNSTYNGIEIAVIGEVKRGCIIRGSTARPGEVIVAAIDLDGRRHSRYKLAWDSTSNKPPEEVKKDLEILVKVGEKGLVRSGRDISNPGVIGTLGMLFEQSGVGGIVDLERIPLPEGVELSHWLKVYPGFGFVFTVEESKAEKCIEVFEKQDVSAGIVGRVLSSSKLLITYQGKEEVVFDFERESITGDATW